MREFNVLNGIDEEGTGGRLKTRVGQGIRKSKEVQTIDEDDGLFCFDLCLVSFGSGNERQVLLDSLRLGRDRCGCGPEQPVQTEMRIKCLFCLWVDRTTKNGVTERTF